MANASSLTRILSRPPQRICTLGAFCALALMWAPEAVGGQVPVSPPSTDTLAVGGAGVSPRGAFLRAVALPGWGHASIGSYRRAAFYFVTEGATAWTLVKTRRRFAEAQDRVQFRDKVLRADLAEEGITDAAVIQARLDDDADLQDLLALEEARRQQREDWTAVGIFMLFLSGADAYVSAHLKDFPVPIQVNAQPVGDGRMELSVGITLPR